MRRLHFLQKTFILYLVLVALNLSCRKLDVVSSSKTITTEEKFFDAHRSSAKEEAAIVNFLKRTNEKSPFVKLTAQKIGFPIWDKLIMRNVKTTRVMSEGGSGQIQSMANTGSCDIYYIPFVRDSQNHVNAAMIIKAFPTDTTIGYLCDWQYKNLLTRPSDSLNVKKFALFFMRFDYSVFSHKRFIVKDRAIFPTKGHASANEVRLELKTDDQKKVKVNSLYTTCQDYSVQYISCPYIRDYGACYGQGGTCDRCDLCPSVTLYFTECWDEWVDDDMGGGSSGDGGTGGGAVPPSDPCSGDGNPPSGPDAIKHINQSQEKVGALSPPPPPPPCDPGWEPEPEPYPIPDSPQDTTQTPCTTAWAAGVKLKVVFDSSKALEKLATIDVANATIEYGFDIMERIKINPYNVHDTGSYGFYTGNLITGTATSIASSGVAYNPSTAARASFLHTHPATGYAAQSPKDIYSLISSRFASDGYRLTGDFVAAADGSKYAISVTNLSQAQSFSDTKAQNLTDSDWNPTSDIGKEYSNAFDYFKKKYKDDPLWMNKSYEMAMAAVLTEFNVGVTLYKQDSQGNFQPIIVRKKSQKTPNGRRTETVYIRDCQED